MNVVALPLPHLFGRPARQLERLAAALATIEPGSLVLLPECALTGYVSARGRFDPTPWAESSGGPLGAACAVLARRFGVHLIAPLAERDEARVENRVVWFDERGERRAHYGKRHPWYPEHWAAPGLQDFPLWEIGGLRCVPVICFDVHFVEAEAAPQLAAADVVLFASAWVEDDPAADSRAAILAGITRRFGCAIANANWGPGAPAVPGQGRSRLLGRDGAPLALPGPDGRVEAPIAATLR